jgi:hypothetical protein
MNTALRYIAIKMREDKVNMGSPGEVVKWMLRNPLPDPKDVAREYDEEVEKERKRRIVILTEELERLEGD